MKVLCLRDFPLLLLGAWENHHPGTLVILFEASGPC